ncbi:hypothetical protein D3C86_1393830 [compost metagenome]
MASPEALCALSAKSALNVTGTPTLTGALSGDRPSLRMIRKGSALLPATPLAVTTRGPSRAFSGTSTCKGAPLPPPRIRGEGTPPKVTLTGVSLSKLLPETRMKVLGPELAGMLVMTGPFKAVSSIETSETVLGRTFTRPVPWASTGEPSPGFSSR